jgi:O-acetylhomoserine/O-acetylserine sulfhydrylase-like pyridoxal-dependent enzyme
MKKQKRSTCETMAILRFNVPDFDAIAAMPESTTIPLVVDNTFGAAGLPFPAPIEHGANIVSNRLQNGLEAMVPVIGGVITDAGNFTFGQTANFLSLPSLRKVITG